MTHGIKANFGSKSFNKFTKEDIQSNLAFSDSAVHSEEEKNFHIGAAGIPDVHMNMYSLSYCPLGH